MGALSDIYYGRVKHPWGVPIDGLSTIPKEELRKIQNNSRIQNEQEISR